VAAAKGYEIADHALSIYANCIKTACPNRPKNSRFLK
jgi:Fur family ferric uptake transcriptional regulator